MGDIQNRGTVSGPWAFGVFTAVCIAATSFTLGGDAAKTVRDQSIEANLLAEGVNSEWIQFCQSNIRGKANWPTPASFAKEALLKALKDSFPKADTSNLEVSGVLVCPLPDPNGTLADALAMDRGSVASYDVLPNSELIYWLSSLALKQSEQSLPDAAATSEIQSSDAKTIARALAEGERLDRVSVIYYIDPLNYFTGDYPDAGSPGEYPDGEYPETDFPREGPYQDPQNYYIEMDYYNALNQSDANSAPVSDESVQIKLSDHDSIFAYSPSGVNSIQAFYFEKRVLEDPHYSWSAGSDNGNQFEFPALAEREDELRSKTVSDIALQLKQELAEKEDNIPVFGVDFSLLQFAPFSTITLVISLLVLARSISLAASEALPPVIRDMPRTVIGLIVVMVVVAWPSALLLLFCYQFRFAYPEFEASCEFASGLWAAAASVILWFSVLVSRRRAAAAQHENG